MIHLRAGDLRGASGRLAFGCRVEILALALVVITTARCGSAPSSVMMIGPAPSRALAPAVVKAAPTTSDPQPSGPEEQPGCPRSAPAVGTACSAPPPSSTETSATIGTLGFCHYDAKPPMCSRACFCEGGHWGCYDKPCEANP